MMMLGKVHERLKPLFWIMGEWKSIKAVVDYPTMKSPIIYSEKLSFISMGHPYLNYKSLTWNDKDGSPMHFESGFLRIDNDATSVAFIIAQGFGAATVEEGSVKDNSIITNTSHIGQLDYIKNKVVSVRRSYKLNEKGQLEYRSSMETTQTPLKEHVFVLYDKCN